MTAATRPGQVLAIVCAGIVLANLDLFIVNVALPNIAQELNDTNLGNLSWILNGYAIVYAALLVFCGRLAERFPRNNSFLAGIAMFTAASAACALEQCRNPGRVPSRAGGRGGIAHPDLAGADPGDLPGRAPRRRGPRMLNLSLALQTELANTGIRVQAVLPGATRTELWGKPASISRRCRRTSLWTPAKWSTRRSRVWTSAR